MKIIADLQLHSKYSRAVSQKMNIDELYFWAGVKGINLMATGDWTHPLWIREIKEKLEETGRGTLRLKSTVSNRLSVVGIRKSESRVPNTENDVEFLLATELSSIYSQGGQTRRVHNLVWVPTILSAEKINRELEKRGCNLSADGRPIVGLSSKELLELVLEVDEKALLIPAHVWTPWFALYGSKSGFSSIDECFEELSSHIYAVETGLSSDPLMNWRLSELDNRSIVSFSDAHSGPKTGREATVFDVEELSYENVRKAITRKTQQMGKSVPQKISKSEKSTNRNTEMPSHSEFSENRISCTFEFYPEEGKYHYDGHRNCNHRQTPEETRTNGIVCPVCGRGLTVGVEYRVDELADRPPVKPIVKTDANGVRWLYHPQNIHPPFVHIVPLLEIISEVRAVGTGAKSVQKEYQTVISTLGDEFHILLKSTLSDIARVTDRKLAEAIGKVRAGDITIDPGFDGVYGKVSVVSEEQLEKKEQIELF